MKKLLPILFLCMGWHGGLFAQSYLVGYVQDGGQPAGINPETSVTSTVGWTSILPGTQAVNAWSPATAIPFPFDFFGAPVTHFKASLNGLITFDTATVLLPSVNEDLPSAALPNNTIACFWDEFTAAPSTGSNDQVYYQTFGTAPNRQFWVRWFSFEIGNPQISFAYFAAVLEEGTNKVYVVDQYASGSPALTTTVGVQLDANTAVQFGDNTLDIAHNGTAIAGIDFYDFFPTSGAPLDVTPISVSFSALAEQGCASANEPITIQVLNVGTSPATGLLASYTVDGGLPVAPEAIPGTLAPGDTVTYTFSATADLSAPITHTVLGIATIIGDADNSNDSLGSSVATTPALSPSLAVVDFTGFTGSNLSTVFPDWSEAEASSPGTPSGTTSGWTSANFAGVAGVNGTATRINLYNLGDFDWILGPKFTVGANTQLSFDIAVTTFSGTNPSSFGSDDSLAVMVSTDCGNTFVPFAVYDVNTPVSNTGQNELYSLASLAGQEVIIGFYATEGSVDDPEDYYVYLDNINIEELVPTDLAVTSIVNPVEPSCLTAPVTITVEILNNGTATLDFGVDNTDIVVDITGANPANFSTTLNTGTLDPGLSMMVDVTTAAAFPLGGVNTLTAYTVLAADPNPINDTTSKDITSVTPLIPTLATVDFTGFNSSNLSTVFPGWSEAETSGGIPSGTTSGWVRDDFGNVVGGPNGDAAKFNIYNLGDNDWIVGPKFTVGANTQLSFDIAVTDFGNTNPENFGSDDSLSVMISTDCGTSYSILGVYDVNTPVSNTGQNEVYSLVAFAGQDVILAFKATEGAVDDPEDFDVFIDNINIEELVPTDLALTAIQSPTDAGCFVNPVTITVEITNNGTDVLDFTVDTADVVVDVTGPNAASYATELNTGTLGIGASLSVDVTTTASLLAGGLNTLTAYVDVAADPNAINDTTISTVESIPLVGVPYLEDFETFTSGSGSAGQFENGWVRYSDNSQNWYVDDATTGSSNTGPSGDHTTGTGNYLYTEATGGVTGSVYYVESPCIEFSGVNSAVLEFWYHMYGLNMGTLEVEVIRADIDTTTVFTVTGEQQAASADPYLQALVDMSSFISDTIKLRFKGIRGPDFESDMAIDDVRIFQQAFDDLNLNSVLSPAGSGRALTASGLTATNDVTIEIINTGLNAAADFPVAYTINGGAAVIDTIPGPLASGDTMQHTFSVQADLSAAGTYDFDMYLDYDVDTDNSNDSAALSLVHLANPALTLPFFEGFENTPDTAHFLSAFGLTGADRFDFEASTAQGRLRTAGGAGFYRTGDRAATLDREPSGDVQINTMDVTLNMSSYSITDTIVFSFSFLNHGEEAHVNDRVWLRGADSLPWIEILDLNATQGGAGTYVDVPEMNISFILDTAGQAYSTSTQIRFGEEDNFPATSISASDGYTFDDILVRKVSAMDLAAVELLSPMDFECGDSLMMGSVLVENLGLDPATASVQVIVTSPIGVMDTFNLGVSSLAFGTGDSLMFGPFNSSAGGDYTIEVITQLTGDEDLANDTLVVMVSLSNSIPPSAMAVADICAGDSTTLMAVAEAGVTFAWYDAPVSGTLLGTGDNLPTGPISAATTFYLGVGPESFAVGAVDTTIGPGLQFTALTAQDVIFEAFAPFTLDSVTVFPQSAGDVVIRLLDLGGAVLNTTTVSVATGGGVAARVPVGFSITPGSYRLDPDGSTVTGLYRNSTGASYPYEVPGVMAITGNTFSAAYYYFFYDWAISATGCRSERTEVSIELVPAAAANFAPAVNELTVSLSDFSTDADSILYLFGDGNSSSDPAAVYTYADSGTFELCQVAFGQCGTDTVCTFVTVTCDFASAGFSSTDSGTVVTFTSTATNADSVVYDFGNGNTSTDANPVFDFDSTGIYTVMMIAYNSCSTDTFTIEVAVNTVGLDDLLDLSSLNLYPNPASDHFVLSMNLRQRADLHVELLNLRGQRIQQESFNGQMGGFQHQFELDNLAKGMYLVKIQLEGQTIYRKLRIE